MCRVRAPHVFISKTSDRFIREKSTELNIKIGPTIDWLVMREKTRDDSIEHQMMEKILPIITDAINTMITQKTNHEEAIKQEIERKANMETQALGDIVCEIKKCIENHKQ